MSGCARTMKSPNGPSVTCPPQLFIETIVLGKLLRIALNQLTARVRTASSFKCHSSPNCSVTSWLMYGPSDPCGGTLVSLLAQRAHGKPGVAPINDGLDSHSQLIEV